MSDELTPRGNAPRLVLLDEDLFEELVEQAAKQQGKEFTIEYGGAFTRTLSYFSPTVYEAYEDGDADPLTIGQD